MLTAKRPSNISFTQVETNSAYFPLADNSRFLLTQLIFFRKGEQIAFVASFCEPTQTTICSVEVSLQQGQLIKRFLSNNPITS